MTRSTIDLRSVVSSDHSAVTSLWAASVGDQFPLHDGVLARCLFRGHQAKPDIVTVGAWAGDSLVGFGYLTSRDRGDPGPPTRRLQAVVVHPEHRRRGLGRAIVQHLFTSPSAHVAERTEVGGGLDYLWPGIPTDLTGADVFTSALGFRLAGTSHDLRSSARTAALANAAAGRLQELNVRVAPASSRTATSLLDFVRATFDQDWHTSLGDFLDDGGSPSDILLAFDETGAVVGFARLHWIESAPIGPPMYWSRLRGPDAGGLGPIGVSPTWRGRGLGTALVGSAVVALRDRGATDIVIDFTDRLKFYGRLGFSPWMTFLHATDPGR